MSSASNPPKASHQPYWGEGSRNERKFAVSSDLFEVRSVLFLPASNPRAIARARESAADLVVLDLEDAVKPADKAAAREAAVDAVTSDWRMPVAIRINGIGTEWHSLDLDAVARSEADFAVLPRAAPAHLVREVREAIGKPLLAMIETATVVLSARAAGIAAFDGVFNRLTDPDGFAAEAAEGRRLGFDGKSLIHPDQIDPCNRAFGASEAEVEKARRLVEAFSGGAERFEDQMIERMHIEAARRTLARAGRP